MLLVVLIVVSATFGVARFIVPVSGRVNRADIFKDLAHIWVGLLIGVAIVLGGWLWLLPVALMVLEIVVFVVWRK